MEEIYFPGDKFPLYIDKKSESLKIIQQMRNEAHRFGIKHHRNKRIKVTLKSELTSIEGVGEKTAQLLFREFKSIDEIKTKSVDQLAEVVGLVRAKSIYHYFLTS